MTTAELEKRLSSVEQELAILKSKLKNLPAGPNAWVEQIAGSFSKPSDKEAFDEAMRLGRAWRKSQRPHPAKKRATKR